MSKPEIEDRDWELDDHDWSHKAWMSVTDADLFEHVLLGKAREAGRLEVLEWGSGRSTRYYSRLLVEAGVPFRWLSLEYNRAYFREEIEPELDQYPGVQVRYVDDAESERLRLGSGPPEGQSVEFVVFDKGLLRPMLRAYKQDRAADLDAYVSFPGRQGRRFDVALVDGRKRRRCVLEVAGMLNESGIVLLHDAWRPYYHCAFDALEAQRRIGDILWIGTQADDAYLDGLLPTS